MNRLTKRLGVIAFLLGSILSISGSAAPELITLSFSGKGTGTSEGRSFSGYVIYDPAKSGTFGVFNFTGSSVAHTIHYEGDGLSTTTADKSNCEPFQLTTNTNTNPAANKLFKVNATTTNGSTTTVLITFPTNVSIYNVLTMKNLPTCLQGTSTKVFVASPASNTAKFTLSGGTTFTGNITMVICNMQ